MDTPFGSLPSRDRALKPWWFIEQAAVLPRLADFRLVRTDGAELSGTHARNGLACERTLGHRLSSGENEMRKAEKRVWEIVGERGIGRSCTGVLSVCSLIRHVVPDRQSSKRERWRVRKVCTS